MIFSLYTILCFCNNNNNKRKKRKNLSTLSRRFCCDTEKDVLNPFAPKDADWLRTGTILEESPQGFDHLNEKTHWVYSSALMYDITEESLSSKFCTFVLWKTDGVRLVWGVKSGAKDSGKTKFIHWHQKELSDEEGILNHMFDTHERVRIRGFANLKIKWCNLRF